jgi:hypothetical protein
LFLGAVVLALGYKLMLAWLDQADATDGEDAAVANSDSS